MKGVVCFILGGGKGTGLFPLTQHRSTPAVTLGAKYRLIDIPISNCINSGLRKIYVITQFQSVSLHRHISNTYKFAPFGGGFVEVLAAQQTNESTDWYRGTADALRQTIRFVQLNEVQDILILSGDGLYRMNFNDLLTTHRECNADITIGAAPVSQDDAPHFGILKVNENRNILSLHEKPKSKKEIEDIVGLNTKSCSTSANTTNKPCLANMGIYLCRSQALSEILSSQPEADDLVKDLLVKSVSSHRMQAHVFSRYWQDIGRSVKTYYDANIALASGNPPFDFHSPEGVIYTRMRNLPASRILSNQVEDSLIGEGCLVEKGTHIEGSIVGQRLRIDQGTTIRSTILSGADFFESPDEIDCNNNMGRPSIGIGKNCIIDRAILDKNCRIGDKVKLVNKNNLDNYDGEYFYIREGIVVIPKGAVIPDCTVI